MVSSNPKHGLVLVIIGGILFVWGITNNNSYYTGWYAGSNFTVIGIYGGILLLLIGEVQILKGLMKKGDKVKPQKASAKPIKNTKSGDRFCPYCGAAEKTGYNFCQNCGKNFD